MSGQADIRSGLALLLYDVICLNEVAWPHDPHPIKDILKALAGNHIAPDVERRLFSALLDAGWEVTPAYRWAGGGIVFEGVGGVEQQ